MGCIFSYMGTHIWKIPTVWLFGRFFTINLTSEEKLETENAGRSAEVGCLSLTR